MKTAGDWPSVALAGFVAFFCLFVCFWLLASGLWCLPLLFAPLFLLRSGDLKSLLFLLSFNLKQLSKIHISPDSVRSSLCRESVQPLTIHRKPSDLALRLG